MKDDERSRGEPKGRFGPLRVIEGGRAALEREVLRAVALDKPNADALLRHLDRPANSSLSIVSPSDSKTTLPRSP